MNKIFFLLIFLLSISCASKKSKQANEILWDSWGIPHIYGTDQAKLYKMMGWAQMRNHTNLILKLYGEARARSAEYWGGDAQKDQLIHQLGLLDAAQNMFDQLEGVDKEIIFSFADGLNAYASKFPDQIEEKYRQVLPIKPIDVVYHSTRVLYYEFLIRGSMGKVNRWSPGSNAWAISGSKTSSGNAMLLSNPHLRWQDFFIFFEAQLTLNDYNIYGTTLVGQPVIGMGFNQNLGWTHTVNVMDNVDLYELTVKGNQYLIDGRYKDFESDSIVLKIKSGSTVTDRIVVKKKSDFGMVIKESKGKAIAVTWPNMDGSMNNMAQWRAMGEAENMQEFKAALDQNTLPLFNVIYSDKDGNILYQFAGNVPKKNGNWGKWQNIVPTSSSGDLWDGFYANSDLPGYVNPTNGWIQNANDPPYTSTIPPALDPKDFASHITPNHMIFRPQRSAKLIMEANDLSLEAFIDLKHDTRSELALRLQDEFETLKTSTDDSLTLAALDVLTAWDGSFDASSEGAILFMNLIKQTGTAGFFEKEWSFQDPVNTPDGLKAPEKMLQVIQHVAQDQVDQLGTISLPLGRLFRLKVGEYEYAGNGGPGNLGLFRTLYYIPGNDGKFYPYHGDSYVCAMEFGDEVKAKALLSYGNATQDGNPHIGDQLKLFSEKKLRDVWFTRKQQEANLEMTEKEHDM